MPDRPRSRRSLAATGFHSQGEGDGDLFVMTTPSLNDKAVIRGVELRADMAVQGLQTALPPSVTQLFLGSTPFTIPDLIGHLQQLEKPWKDARAAHATVRQVVQDRPQDYQNLLSALVDLKGALQGVFGHQSEDLTKFGFKPTKRRKPLTSEQKAVRAAKAKLTRQKRGTLGKKQKAAIKETAAPTVTIGPDGKSVITPASSGAPAAPVPSSSQAPVPVTQAPSVPPAPPAVSDPQPSAAPKP